MGPTVADIKQRLHEADEREFAVLERSLVADARKGVRDAVERARARLAAEAAERQRLASLYAFERALAAERGDGVIVGLDEVGRGPLAGPLAVGAVVLPSEPFIEGLNDSKQVKPEARERIAVQVKAVAVAWTVEYVEASDIDACGMTASLALAFRRAIRRIEEAGVRPDVVLLDGNPMRLDEREVNVVKGDGKCASIAAAIPQASMSDEGRARCAHVPLRRGVPRIRRRRLQGLRERGPYRGHQALRSHAHPSRDVLHGLHATCPVLAPPRPSTRFHRCVFHACEPFGAPSGASWTAFPSAASIRCGICVESAWTIRSIRVGNGGKARVIRMETACLSGKVSRCVSLDTCHRRVRRHPYHGTTDERGVVPCIRIRRQRSNGRTASRRRAERRPARASGEE